MNTDKEWDWNRMIPSWDFNSLSIKGYPGWEMTARDKPFFVMQEITKGAGKSSRQMAIEFDDIANGNFYYRDWTADALPFVEDGETHWTGFWFQNERDARKFVQLFGGNGSWQPDHDEFVRRCNAKRNGR